MNPTEDFSNVQNTSEHFRSVLNTSEDFSTIQSASKRTGGIGRGKKYPGSETPEHEYDGDDFIIMEEAYTLFEREGERRSVRMIAEYCKNGELVCFYDSDDKRWHITRTSVENKIGKIKALNARKAAPASQNTSEETAEAPDASERTADSRPHQSDSSHESSDAIRKLEQENLDLKIVNRGKDYFIEQLQRERESFITRIENNSRLIGELETKLLQLEAPQPRPRHDPEPQSHVSWREADHIPPSGDTRPIASETRPSSSLSASDNINDHYEHSSQHGYPEDQRESFRE